MNQFNAGQQNRFAQAQFGAENQFALANQQAQNKLLDLEQPLPIKASKC